MNSHKPLSLVDQIRRRCIHFTKIPIFPGESRHCNAGVCYDDVRDTQRRGPFRWPCLIETDPDSASPAGPTCASRRFPTLEEARAEAAEWDHKTAEFTQRLALGHCTECGDVSTDWRQIGPCIYAQPCGHRVAQGDAKRYRADVLKAREGR